MFKTALYIKNTFGKKAKDMFVKAVINANKLISSNPFIEKCNKIIYCDNVDHISIVDFWDCRRDPNALVSQVT